MKRKVKRVQTATTLIEGNLEVGFSDPALGWITVYAIGADGERIVRHYFPVSEVQHIEAAE